MTISLLENFMRLLTRSTQHYEAKKYEMEKRYFSCRELKKRQTRSNLEILRSSIRKKKCQYFSLHQKKKKMSIFFTPSKKKKKKLSSNKRSRTKRRKETKKSTWPCFFFINHVIRSPLLT